ncbi:carboxymuconolactone decarboxylase family protein [Candidatus Entotheonella palauensis]|uniref:carboxymuconolactone decarboxylase family protein n=1 Tax=Candidatus Entotheonella palauensis TaxID=93172 RepID=UPI000B7D5FCB|nr:carboxymuconolactone decarboxylase family protein [Candidatus Entotheonella palauensis]
MIERADFRQSYRDAHAVDNLSEREKIFMGLAVAMVRNCQPRVERRLADARKAGIDETDLDCAVDVIAAVDAGILQSLNIRSKAQLKRQGDG